MLLHLGQNVIAFTTLLHLGSFITFRPLQMLHEKNCNNNSYGLFRLVYKAGLYRTANLLLQNETNRSLVLLMLRMTCL